MSDVEGVKMPHYDESCLIFAARYAHHRKTGAANVVVSSIIGSWGNLSPKIKADIKKEALEATTNLDDWKRIIDREN